MPRIVLVRDLKHEQIEFPADLPCPDGRRGGRKSSLHLRRGSVRDVTVEELQWMREHAADVLRCCDVLAEPMVPSRAARKLKAAADRAARAAEAARKPKASAGSKKRASARSGAKKGSDAQE